MISNPYLIHYISVFITLWVDCCSMSDWSLSSTSRRAVLATGVASLTSLAGCSDLESDGAGAPFSRIAARSETEQTERVELILSYAPKDSSVDRLVRDIYEVPASGEQVVVDDFEGTPGFYSLSAFSENHSTHGTYSVNSYSQSVNLDPVQFEVLIEEDGGIWLNLGEAGSEILPSK